MAEKAAGPRWRKHVERVRRHVQSIRFPEARDLAQDHEYCDVTVDGNERRIRFHDYHEVYDIPGLYEAIFYDRLKCNSPARVIGLLEDVLREFGGNPEQLRVLDVGAGNGMVGEELAAREVECVVGVDIVAAAKRAALRDRPDTYTDYCVADLTDLDEKTEQRLRQFNFNTLSVVAALGFGDIPAAAFLKALDLVETPGWLAFNIKEDFLRPGERTGFAKLIGELNTSQVIQVQAYRRYRHRVSTTGRPLHYLAMVAKKLKDVPDELMGGDGAGD